MSPTRLLDGNVLVALGDAAHVHHAAAVAWFSSGAIPFATCPITQGTLLRLLLRHAGAATPEEAWSILRGFTSHPRHHFWKDALSYADVPTGGLAGHRQITDAYLAALARSRRGRLATFDQGLAAVHSDVAELIVA